MQPISCWERPYATRARSQYLEGYIHLTTSKFHPKGDAMQAKVQEQISPIDAKVILERLTAQLFPCELIYTSTMPY